MGKKIRYMSKAKHKKYPAELTTVDNFYGAREKTKVTNIHKIEK